MSTAALTFTGSFTTPTRAAQPAPSPHIRIDSRELLQGSREVVIQHGDQEYRLRHTQNGKLILTK